MKPTQENIDYLQHQLDYYKESLHDVLQSHDSFKNELRQEVGNLNLISPFTTSESNHCKDIRNLAVAVDNYHSNWNNVPPETKHAYYTLAATLPSAQSITNTMRELRKKYNDRTTSNADYNIFTTTINNKNEIKRVHSGYIRVSNGGAFITQFNESIKKFVLDDKQQALVSFSVSSSNWFPIEGKNQHELWVNPDQAVHDLLMFVEL